MATRYLTPTTQHFNKATKSFLSGGQMFFFEPGSTTTPKDTFSDSAGLIANTNPVILDGNGLEPDIFGEGSYRVVLTSQVGDDIQQWVRDPVNLTDVSGNVGFSDWLSTVDYAVNDLVQGSDGRFYLSIVTPNINNDPIGATAAFWTEFDLVKRWNTNEVYEIDDIVTLSNTVYLSLTGTNSGNNPSLDTTNWTGPTKLPTSEEFLVSGTWNKPAGLKYVVVECIGSGGGGGSSGTTAGASGGGGGGGGWARKIVDDSALGSSETVTIGAAGTAGVTSSGGAGASVSFGSVIISALAGGGGSRGSGGSAPGGTGGPGGGPSDFRVTGGDGQDGQQGVIISAQGGDSSFGAGGYGTAAAGTGGTTGGGGAAGRNTGAEQNGAAGIIGLIIVTNYFQ